MESNLPLMTKAKVVLTNQCQLRCKYCYERHGTDRMDFSVAKDIINLIWENAQKSNRLPELSFFGGEPLLVYDELMVPCIEYMRDTLKSRGPINFTTNGILLDEDKLKYLKSRNVTFMLSMDGCQQSHDANRVYRDGYGSFSDIKSKLPLILKYYPSMRVRMTATPENIKYLYDSVRFVEDSGFIDMHILPDLHIRSGWKDEDFSVLREQLNLLESHIIEKFESQEVPLIFNTLSDMFTRIVLEEHCEKLDHHRTLKCCQPECRCGLGTMGSLSIDMEGNIFSCLHGSWIPENSNVLYLGNIYEGIDSSRVYKLLEMNKEPIRSRTLNCKECPVYHVCTGGCVPNNYIATGDFTIPPEAYCTWMRVLHDSALRIIQHFDEKKDNTLFKDYFYGIVRRGVSCVC